MQAINDRKNLEWRKLRQQKIAYEKRLRDRISQQTERDQIALIEAIISLLSSKALEIAAKDQSEKLRAALET